MRSTSFASEGPFLALNHRDCRYRGGLATGTGSFRHEESPGTQPQANHVLVRQPEATGYNESSPNDHSSSAIVHLSVSTRVTPGSRPNASRRPPRTHLTQLEYPERPVVTVARPARASSSPRLGSRALPLPETGHRAADFRRWHATVMSERSTDVRGRTRVGGGAVFTIASLMSSRFLPARCRRTWDASLMSGVGRDISSATWPGGFLRCRPLEGIDAAPRMVETARSMGNDPRLGFRVGVAEELPYDDGSFGLVVSTTSFDHWRDQQGGIRECARVLEPRAHLLVFMPHDGAT